MTAASANDVFHSVLISAALVQNDIHSPATTIREALYFSACCRLTDVDKHQLQEFVEEVCNLKMLASLPSYNLIAYPACWTLPSRILLADHLPAFLKMLNISTPHAMGQAIRLSCLWLIVAFSTGWVHLRSCNPTHSLGRRSRRLSHGHDFHEDCTDRTWNTQI